MVFSMYEPAARDDEQKLARLMNLYKWMYRAVAASVLLFGLVLLPFLPYLIKGGEGIEHITLIYMIYVLGSASSYLLSYKIPSIRPTRKAISAQDGVWRASASRLFRRSRCCC